MKNKRILKIQQYFEKNNIEYEGISDNRYLIHVKWISADITYKQVNEIYNMLHLNLSAFVQ